MTAYTKTILVTGGAGFIGSAYLNHAVPKHPGYRFVNLDALTYAGNLGNIAVSGAPNYAFVQADIRDTGGLANAFDAYMPTDVVHFAAESHVDNSIAAPAVFVETNVIGTANLLAAACASGLSRFHHISTDEVYGSLSSDAEPKKEEAVLDPSSPYSASKAAAEMFVKAYHKTYGMDTVITRLSNTYGPRQYAEKLIPLFITKLLAGEKVPLYAEGANIRQWLYVEDAAEGIDAAFHKGKSGEIYNLGGNAPLSNMEVVRMLLVKLGHDDSFIAHVADRPGHDFRYAIDSSKAAKEFGWNPSTPLPEGITRTIAYYADLLS